MRNGPTNLDDLPWDVWPRIYRHFNPFQRLAARTLCRSLQTIRPDEVIPVDGFISNFSSLQAFFNEVRASHTAAPIHVRLHDYDLPSLMAAANCPTLTLLHLDHDLDLPLAEQLLKQLPASLQSLSLNVSDRHGCPESIVSHPAWGDFNNLRSLAMRFVPGGAPGGFRVCRLPSLPQLRDLRLKGISEHRLSFEGVNMPRLELLCYDNDLFSAGPQNGQLPALQVISILPGGLVPEWLYNFEVPTLDIQDWCLWELTCSFSRNRELCCQTLRLALPTWARQEASLNTLLMFPPRLTALELAAGAPDAPPASPILLRGSGEEVDAAIRRWGPSLQPVWLQDGTWVPGLGPAAGPSAGGGGVQTEHHQGAAPSQQGGAMAVQQAADDIKEVVLDQDAVMADAESQQHV
ncbi:hypothetical protein WJX74_005369 [Apatococcus lobatus]|uniref:F-box domain-containing protein n=1 Tax=Apatococcus lobatus TaxID=904363 RepID=A0AAW1Q9B1_9CHLO